MRYLDITVQFEDPVTGVAQTPDSAEAQIFLVDQQAEGQLSLVDTLVLAPRESAVYPGLMWGKIDTELLPGFGVYRIRAVGMFGLDQVAQLQTFEVKAEDDNTKVI